MESENKGYTLAIVRLADKQVQQKVYLKPMALYVPDVAHAAVSELAGRFSSVDGDGNEVELTVTNNNNGVSVDRTFPSLTELLEPAVAADSVKDLINIVRGYDSDEETNVCGW
ncbi:hypothetical protein TUM12370_00730 [Salmonella enterica subsp. enterica serovar Choleraesuis]|nr:hypothetical protein TUM12370_00730 [Salmonella enterica subsp. enterica serovar Choleraesuis]